MHEGVLVVSCTCFTGLRIPNSFALQEDAMEAATIHVACPSSVNAFCALYVVPQTTLPSYSAIV